MKTKSLCGWILTSAVAVACVAGNLPTLQAQPAAPDAVAPLPPNIDPDSPLGQVVKLVQANVDTNVITAYINNSGNQFNLDAEKIIALNDLGVPSTIVNAMMAHDRNLGSASAATAPSPSAPPANTASVSTIAAPTAPVTEEYFDNTLSPYGSWVVVEGYGRCWRPTTVVYDAGWQPYCDRGHWVYTDCGWYWDSDYSWGVTFHYGRWFRHDRFGWCWWPETTWAPSWVTWRQSDAYCGWAPLPPFAIYRPGAGFYYRGASVAVGFDFGISSSCFTFVSVGHFNERHPRYYREDSHRRDEIFHQTTIINNFHDDHHTVFNGGISVDRFHGVNHRPIEPIAVSHLPNAGRQGWRGGDDNRADHRGGNAGFENGAARNGPGSQIHSGPGQRNDRGNAVNADQPGNRNGQRDRDLNNHSSNPNASAGQNNVPTGNNNHPAPGTPFVHGQGAGNNTGQNDHPTGGNDRGHFQNNHNQSQPQFTPANNVPIHSTPANNAPVMTPTPPRNQSQPQFTPANNAPNLHANTPNDWRQNQAPVVSTPPRSVPSMDQRQISTPRVIEAPQHQQRTEPRIEQRQNPVVSAPRYVAPPSPPPSQNQSHNSGQNQNRGSDRDRQNH